MALLWPAQGPLSSRTTPFSVCTPRSPAAPTFRRCRRPISPLKRPLWGSYLNVRPRSAEAVHRILIPTAQAQHALRKATGDLHRGHLHQPVCRACGVAAIVAATTLSATPARRTLPRSGWLRWSAHPRRADWRPGGSSAALSTSPASRSTLVARCLRSKPGLIVNPAPQRRQDDEPAIRASPLPNGGRCQRLRGAYPSRRRQRATTDVEQPRLPVP
jgi:hypothetical protein